MSALGVSVSSNNSWTLGLEPLNVSQILIFMLFHAPLHIIHRSFCLLSQNIITAFTDLGAKWRACNYEEPEKRDGHNDNLFVQDIVDDLYTQVLNSKLFFQTKRCFT